MSRKVFWGGDREGWVGLGEFSAGIPARIPSESSNLEGVWVVLLKKRGVLGSKQREGGVGFGEFPAKIPARIPSHS